MMKMKNSRLFALAMTLVMTVSMTSVHAEQEQVTAETAPPTIVQRNVNNVLQMPSDGLALNVLGGYTERDSANNITALNFPTTAAGEIDTQVLVDNTENYLANYLTDTQVGRVFFISEW